MGAARRVTQVEAERIEHLASYLHAVAREAAVEPMPAGAERARRYGGPGTPRLAEFTEEEAREADFRLAAHHVDQSPLLARVTMSRLRQILDQIRYLTRPDEVADDVASGLADRYVTFCPSTDGVAEIDGRVSGDDAARLESRIRHVVGWLRELGDRRTVRELRPVALGWMADPDRLGMLHDQTLLGPATDDREAHDVPEASATTTREVALPATTLYVHWDRGSGTWSLEGAGPITRSEAVGIRGHSRVTVRPVIDLSTNPSYTGYVAPPRLREHTALLNAGLCTFPSCNRSARGAEYDHQENYAVEGPPDARNGHRLCKHHHRCKTFTRWRVSSPGPGVWLWRSPGPAATS